MRKFDSYNLDPNQARLIGLWLGFASTLLFGVSVYEYFSERRFDRSAFLNALGGFLLTGSLLFARGDAKVYRRGLIMYVLVMIVNLVIAFGYRWL